MVELPARLVQHPRPQRPYEARVFGDPDERIGSHEAVVGTPPAQEGLDTDKGAALDGHDRLVHDIELVARDRAAQGHLGAEPAGRLVVHRLRGDLRTRRPARLRLVHRRVRVAQHGLRRVAGAPEGDTHAGADDQLVAAENDRALHFAGQSLEIAGDFLTRADGLSHDDELVATEAGDRVTPSHDGAQAIGNHDEDLVPLGMAPAVVDELEAIQIQEDDGDETPVAFGVRERLADAVP